MKSKILAVLALGAVLLLTGCWQKSLHPFYKDPDIVFDEKLIGTWQEIKESDDKGMTWFITRSESKSVYRIKIEDGEIKLDYDGRLFRLGGENYLDLYSRGRPIAEIPAHNLFKVEGIDGSFKARILSRDWIQKRLQANPAEIPHIKAHDPEEPNEADKAEVILTGTTEQLQKFIRDHNKADEFWSDAVSFKLIETK